ncbi:MAG: FAD:protein FMN transferase [Candidatus Riflebacteria bacterium]|nr:FAD:protein FMN transferase [Candidatus Riflebacteria bacterium]
MGRQTWSLILLARLWFPGLAQGTEPVECFAGRPSMGTVLEVTVGEGWQPVSEDLGAVLHASRRLFDGTRGAFDVTLGPVILADRSCGGAGGVDPGRRRVALEAVGGRGLVAMRRLAGLARPGMAVDLGGIGKGHATDRVAELLRSRGAVGGYLDFGRSSQAGFGPRGWKIGVTGLDGCSFDSLELRDRSLSTSEAGSPDNTVLDPTTGSPVRDRRLVTVRAASGVDAEGWSTALVVLGRPGLKLVPRGLDVFYRDEAGVVRLIRSDDAGGRSDAPRRARDMPRHQDRARRTGVPELRDDPELARPVQVHVCRPSRCESRM